MKPRTLIVDGLNFFIRSYVIDPSLCADGFPCGGCKGFLKSLQKICKETKPINSIVVVWDGEGGSKRKKKLNADYKDGRAPIKLNRSIHNLTEEEERINKAHQFSRLISYLNEMPIIQFAIDNVEADDVISYVCHSKHFEDNIKIIVSSDKDFIQLCDNETILYRPVQKEILNEKRIVAKYNIHPKNFTLVRAITGDQSDNLSGVRGAGLPTISKRFPFLTENKRYLITDILSYCEEHKDEYKIYGDILKEEEKIKMNYKISQLYSPTVSPNACRNINETLMRFKPYFNQTSVTSQMIVDGFTDYRWEDLFQSCRFIANSK